MNRRSFLSAIAKAAAAFTILPSAVTYERTWRKEGKWKYENGLWIDTEYKCIMLPPKMDGALWIINFDETDLALPFVLSRW